MRAVTSTIRTVATRDGIPILVRRWAPDDDPWAHVLLVHGIAEHSGRYEHVGGWLAGAGLDVTGYDLRGFGASGGRRAWLERWSDEHDDLEDRLAELRAETPALPVVLYGHSFGALVALGYAVADPARPLPDVLVLSAPALESTLPGWQRVMARVLNGVAPTFEVRNAFDGTILSRDPAVAERYLADPLNYHSLTARFGVLALAEQARVRTAASRLSIPTLVYHGADDRLVPPSASEPLAALPTVTRRTYPGLRHESHNEPEGEQVIGDVVRWLRETLDPDGVRQPRSTVQTAGPGRQPPPG
jgi:alpha-beta hydrolase superfamily lysophospholipase